MEKKDNFCIKYTTKKPVNQLNETPSQNILKHASGPRLTAKCAWTPLEAFSLFINDEMLNTIVENTNILIETFLAGKQDMIDDSDKYSFYKKVDLIDIKAFLGLLYLHAHLKLNMFDCEIIWHYEMANNFFEAMMSLNCFIFISRFIGAPEQKVGDIILPACDLSLKVLMKIFPNLLSIKLSCCWQNFVPISWKNWIQTV